MPDFADPFDVQIGQWVARAKERGRLAFVATAEDALAEVKELTPVKTGYLRANWTAIRAGDAVPVEGASPNPAVALAALQLGDKIIIVNPVRYARRVEFGFVGQDSLGRHYDQKGRGMMTQTIADTPRLAQRATIRVLSA